MSHSSPEPPTDPAAQEAPTVQDDLATQGDPAVQSTPSRAPKWPLWLGIGFFGVVGVVLLVLLLSFLRGGEEVPTVAGAPDAELAEGNPADDLRAHQAHVSEVVADLGREFLIGDSPTLGNPDAEIVMLEFSDFQCPYCSRAAGQVEAFMADHDSEVLLVFKHLPLTSIHPEALPAALASWAADQQDQFWPFHKALFANQAELSDEVYVQIAEDLGLDIEQFNRDRASEAAKAAVARDLALAQEFQLRSTPTFIMDNLLIPGAVPSDFFAEALQRLQAAQ